MDVADGNETSIKLASKINSRWDPRLNHYLSSGIDVSDFSVSHKTKERVSGLASDAPDWVAPCAGGGDLDKYQKGCRKPKGQASNRSVFYHTLRQRQIGLRREREVRKFAALIL